MSIEALKEQARRHEQREEWKEALGVYRRAIDRLAQDDQPDVGLYNRVGDLCVRIADLDEAMRHYEQAVDLYIEAELPNNAIAVCKKIIRNVPGRSAVFLRMGRIRAQQGFLTDARQNFLMYAEQVQAAGDLGEALRALKELAALSPGDVELHLSLAQQLQQHGSPEEALELLRSAHAALLEQGDGDRALEVEEKARQIDPAVDLTPAAAPEPVAPAAEHLEVVGSFGEIEFSGREEEAAEQEPEEELAEPSRFTGLEVSTAGPPTGADADEDEEAAEPLPTFDVGEEEEEAEPLPTFDLGEEEEEAEPLPTFDVGEEEEEAEPLPTFDLGDEEEEEAEPLPLLTLEDEPEERVPATAQAAEPAPGVPPAPEDLIAAGDLGGAQRRLRELMAEEPSEISHRQRLVEVAFRSGDSQARADAYLELARCLELNGNDQQAGEVYQQVLQLDPENRAARSALKQSERPPAAEPVRVASSDDYVDLGAFIFDDDEEEKTTRFRVAYEEPSGDEQADFARMLSQFKAKIAENVDLHDVRAHHDLGTAYMEMGLTDEAIEEFQAALRARRDHLPTYELLGQCFLQKGQSDAAIKSLTRALTFPVDVEDELLGIYYYLGRAHEETGNQESAVEFFDRVFSLDINFMDVTERLRALR